MIAYDEIYARGHPNIKAIHRTTLEITREKYLTPRGDCIIGVASDKAARDLNDDLKKIIKRSDSIIVIILRTNNYMDYILATGSDKLILGDDKKVIIRKSTYIEPATIAIRSNKAARDIDRRLINELRNSDTVLRVKIIGLTLDEIYSVNIGVGGIV
jgi:hypothetical protein